LLVRRVLGQKLLPDANGVVVAFLQLIASAQQAAGFRYFFAAAVTIVFQEAL